MTTTEDLLRDALHAKAGDAVATLTLDDVRHAASAARRRSLWLRAGAVAAAAAVAVGVPTALLIRSGDESPSPAPSPSPTSAPTASAASVLAGLPESAPPGISYLEGRTVHLASGGTATLPGPTSVSAFAAYHGGWLVADDVMGGVRWYDNENNLKTEESGATRMAASADGTLLAFPMDGGLDIGIASGMGEGEQKVAITGDPLDAWPAGFLTGGALVYNDGGAVKTDQAVPHPVPTTMVEADAVSTDDVVAGKDADGKGMAWSARTGETLWKASAWVVTDFSADGRYAAATRTTDGGGKAVAILDARTGALEVEDVFAGSDLDPLAPVMDTDDSLLFVGVDPKTQDRAVVRLEPSGAISRASDILRFDQSADPSYVVFATGS